MILEDFVSFEIAKLLKEKEFNEICSQYYSSDGRFNMGVYSNYNIDDDRFSAPTIQMAMKWLRDAHNLFIFPFPQMNTNKFWSEIYQLSDNQEWVNLYCESIDLLDYSSHEEACEAAIKYCLENLI
jgi:hypothetical protein